MGKLMRASIGNSQTIARNSFWYSLELLFSFCAAFFTSVAVARIIGPQRLSYFNYLVWLTNITTSVGAVGLPVTTRKYMAEYLNRGEKEVARAAYLATLKIQSLIAAGVTLLALSLVLAVGNPGYRVISVLLVVAMPARMVGFIPSQANNAAEVLKRNTAPALIGGLLTTLLTVFSLWIGWNLTGVAVAVTIGPMLETTLKLRSVESWLGSVRCGVVSPELRKRMFSYSGQGLALMLLNVVVWDRSDMVFLKALNSDAKQITFFSIAFNLTERILMLPNAFGGSLGATMMAQFGRGQAKLQELTVNGARYALLLALPLLVGMACISHPLVLLLYGKPYQPLIPALALIALMAVPKALVAAPTLLLQTTERQGFLIFWGCICGAVDMGLDVLLTPRHGAVGAGLANGSAQALAALGIWIYAWRRLHLDLRLKEFARIFLSAAVMAAGVLATNHWLHGYPGMVAAIVAGAVIWFAALRLSGALTAADANRFRSVGSSLPAPVRPYWNRLVGLLAPAAAAAC
jgi:O-antigen/teichoic acid export membrane protein